MQAHRLILLVRARPPLLKSALAPELALTLVLTFTVLVAPACAPRQVMIDLSPRGPELTRSTVIVETGIFGDRVALIDVSGIMLNSEQPQLFGAGEHPVSLLYEQLQHAAADKRVRAVVLRLNTPGGTVTASDAMYREVQRFRQHTGMPVVALMMDVAASGGYYLACASDAIVAYPTSLTGSIGVIVQTFSVKRGMELIGIDSETIVSGPQKDVGSPFATITDEHRQILQNLVDDYHERFMEVVRENRPRIDQDIFDEVADGRVVSGDRATELGLVDQTGDIHDAFALAKNLAGIDRADLVRYHRPRAHVRSPYASASPRISADAPTASTTDRYQINLFQFNLDNLSAVGASPGIYYLWRPDAQ